MGPENDTPEKNVDLDVETRSPYEFSIRVTQSDPELQVIEAVMTLLQLLPNDANRAGVLRYLNDRFDTVLDARITPGGSVSRDDVARALALADGRDWSNLSTVHRSTYYRRTDALLVAGMTVIRTQG